MLNRRTLLATLGLAAAPGLGDAFADPLPEPGRRAWASHVPALRIATMGGQHNPVRVRQLGAYAALLEATFDVPATVQPFDERDRMVDALVAGALDIAYCSPRAYVTAWDRSNHNVIPMVALQENDGTASYRSILVVRADGPVRTLADLRGRSLAWVSPTSGGGYMVPRAAFRAQGIDPEPGRFFGQTAFAGGHEATVRGVLDGTWDAGFTWTSGQGDAAQGFSRGILRMMADSQGIDPALLRVIWTSPPLPSGPVVVRADTPAAFRADMLAFHLGLGSAWPSVLAALEGMDAAAIGQFVPARHADYVAFFDPA